MNKNLISLAAARYAGRWRASSRRGPRRRTSPAALAGVKNGTVRMSFASRDDICGYGQRDFDERETGFTFAFGLEQLPAVGRRRLRKRLQRGSGASRCTIPGRTADEDRVYVGGQWAAGSDVTDVGTVSVKEATEYLLGIARTQSGKAAGEAIFSADARGQRQHGAADLLDREG